MSINVLTVVSASIKGRLMTSDKEKELLIHACKGNLDAFEEIFFMHRDFIFRYAYQMLGCYQDAEDITQEVFVRAYKNLQSYRNKAKFRTWLTRIASNLCTDRIRMTKRRLKLEQKEAAEALSWMTISEEKDPIEKMESERKMQLLRKAIQNLPDNHRTAIILRDIQEREYADVADVFNCSIGGAKIRVLRARRALRKMLSSALGEFYEKAQ